MSKEQQRNIDLTYDPKRELNEFEYQQHHAEMTEQEHQKPQKGLGKQVSRAEQIAKITEAAHRKVEKKRKKSGGESASKAAKKASNKSSTKSTKPAAKKRSAGKTSKKK